MSAAHGPPSVFDRAMTPAERQRRRRARLRGEIPPWPPKPKKRPPEFAVDSPLMRGLASIDDMELQTFNMVSLDDE